MNQHISCLKDVESVLFDFPTRENLFTELKKYIGFDNKLLCAVSGGVDSMFVAVLLYRYYCEMKYDTNNVMFLHLHHGVRKESDKEAELMRKFFGDNVLVKHYEGVDKKEADLRHWRYQQYEETCQNLDVDFVVTGHHLDDRVESTFLHMLRGAGVNGFLAMQFCEHHHLLSKAKMLRPALGLRKVEIQTVIDQYKLPYVVDQSNFDPEVSKRNKLRNTILPALYTLANKYDDEGNTFIESLSNIYSVLETSKSEEDFLGLTLEEIDMAPGWQADWAYRFRFSHGALNIDTFLSILKDLKVANNVTKANLVEMVDFLTSNESGYKYFNGVTYFVAHGSVYAIKAEREFWKKTPTDMPAEGGDRRYPQVGDMLGSVNRNRYCLKQKIPVFWRNFIAVLVEDGQVVAYKRNGKKICKS